MSPASRSSPLRRIAISVMKSRLTLYHHIDAVVPRVQTVRALSAYPRFLRERRAYERASGFPLSRYDDNPQLTDWIDTTPFDPHYTYQDGWAAREIFQRSPDRHVDVGSRISFVVGLAAFVPVTFIDLRPLQIDLPGLESMRGSILELPYGDGAVPSLSSLHVAEHIGLGRYGDPLDPNGTAKAAQELQRVLARNGSLYFSVPVGRPRTAFNAHRVLDPLWVVDQFDGLRLEGFGGVDDDGAYHADLAPSDFADAHWSCGFYRFTKP